MSATVITVADFGNRHQAMAGVRQVKLLRKICPALKRGLSHNASTVVDRMRNAAELAVDVANVLEQAAETARLDGRKRAPRALREIIRGTRANAEALRRVALQLEEAGLLETTSAADVGGVS